MFRLIRLPFLLGAAFVAGIFYERAGVSEGCREEGGRMLNGICYGAEQ